MRRLNTWLGMIASTVLIAVPIFYQNCAQGFKTAYPGDASSFSGDTQTNVPTPEPGDPIKNEAPGPGQWTTVFTGTSSKAGWSLLPLGPVATSDGLYFVTYDYCSSTPCSDTKLNLYKSVDRGVTWKLLKSASSGLGFHFQLVTLTGGNKNLYLTYEISDQFTPNSPNAKDYVTVSSDGGETWASLPITTPKFSTFHIIENEAGLFTLGRGDLVKSGQSQAYQALLSNSADSGKTWTTLDAFGDPDAAYSMIDYEPRKLSIVRDDPTHLASVIFANKTPSDPKAPFDYTYVIRASTDGGKTWISREVTKESYTLPTVVTKALVVTARGSFVSSQPIDTTTYSIKLSRDDGQTWTDFSLELAPAIDYGISFEEDSYGTLYANYAVADGNARPKYICKMEASSKQCLNFYSSKNESDPTTSFSGPVPSGRRLFVWAKTVSGAELRQYY